MWTVIRRFPVLSASSLILAAGLLAAWLELSHIVFAAVLGTVVFVAVLTAAIWASWRQTTPASLEARGMYADDSSLPIYEPGLRREYQPMLPFGIGRQTSAPRTP